jgi:hypothetical protein
MPMDTERAKMAKRNFVVDRSRKYECEMCGKTMKSFNDTVCTPCDRELSLKSAQLLEASKAKTRPCQFCGIQTVNRFRCNDCWGPREGEHAFELIDNGYDDHVYQPDQLKRCNICKQEKLRKEFSPVKANSGHTSYHSYCKPCHREYRRARLTKGNSK